MSLAVPDRYLILGSRSPRRQEFMRLLGIAFEIREKEYDESFPPTLPAKEIALYIAEKKAERYAGELKEKEVVLTADTIVVLDGRAINKPNCADDACRMLGNLSGKMHEVFTGVCLKSPHETFSFAVCTEVHFRTLTNEEIWHYVKTGGPLDKAGAYGLQDWIGLVGIEKINGSYSNVVGLPVMELYLHLQKMEVISF